MDRFILRKTPLGWRWIYQTERGRTLAIGEPHAKRAAAQVSAEEFAAWLEGRDQPTREGDRYAPARRRQ